MPFFMYISIETTWLKPRCTQQMHALIQKKASCQLQQCLTSSALPKFSMSRQMRISCFHHDHAKATAVYDETHEQTICIPGRYPLAPSGLLQTPYQLLCLVSAMVVWRHVLCAYKSCVPARIKPYASEQHSHMCSVQQQQAPSKRAAPSREESHNKASGRAICMQPSLLLLRRSPARSLTEYGNYGQLPSGRQLANASCLFALFTATVRIMDWMLTGSEKI